MGNSGQILDAAPPHELRLVIALQPPEPTRFLFCGLAQ